MAISNLIKKGGGTDFSKTTGGIGNAVASSHEPNVVLDITGSGYLTGLIGGSSSYAWRIQIDGGTIRAVDATNGNMFIRFKTRVKVTNASAGLYASYILD